jgi:peptidoglycan/xylan/chitin deacetylase (PgdA/CDA1 family)
MRNRISNRIINLTISLFVASFDFLRYRLARLFGRHPQKQCVVFVYHSVNRSQRSRFARQMDVLIRHSHPVRVDIPALPDDANSYAAITFDDGIENIVENALPELRKRNIPATIFVVSDMLGGSPGWEFRGANSTLQEKAMSEVQLQELPTDLVTIGSHTATHPFLPLITDQTLLRNELYGSRLKLEKILGREVKLFSSPYGEFNERVVNACREAGYERLFSALPFLAFQAPSEFVCGRVGAAPTDWPIEFRLKLAGAYRWVPYAYKLKRTIFPASGQHASKQREVDEHEKIAAPSQRISVR